MKWILFALFCCFAVPGMSLVSNWRPARKWLLALLVFTTVVKISVNFCSIESYRGADRGFEVSVTDLIAASLAVGLVCTQFRKICWIPFNLPMLAALFSAFTVSTLLATDQLLASFTLVKVAKGLVLYWTVYNLFRIEAPLEGLWWGMLGTAGCLTALVFYQKYGQGLYRTPGTFDHSNTIPAYCLMQIPFLLSWMMHRERLRRWQLAVTLAAMLGMCFCVVSTLSRAGAVLMAAVIVAVVGWALIRCPLSGRRAGLTALIAMLMVVGVAKSLDTLVARFLHAPEESYDARDEFNRAALLMAGDHTFGVGLNCYSRTLTHVPQYRDHFRVMKNEEQAGVCHHIYLLTAAESGWLGAGLLVAVLLRFWLRLLRPALCGASFHRCLLLSMAVGLGAVHTIGMVEWVLRMTPVFNMFLIMTAVSVALAERLDAAAPPRDKRSWLRRTTALGRTAPSASALRRPAAGRSALRRPAAGRLQSPARPCTTPCPDALPAPSPQLGAP